jgi:acyl-CoA synthetase (AMP-forming)/AMP-acid ligase II
VPEWTIGDVVDAIAGAIPDRTMTVCGDRRTSYRDRAALRNWECGQDRVALVMYNDRYPEMVLGCLKARAVPVNVNHHYTPREVAELLDYVKPRAVIYHRALGAKFADVLPDGVADALVVGRPSDRWGEEVLALVEKQPGILVEPEALAPACRSHLAKLNVPEEFRFVDMVRRLGNGKADYGWAKAEPSVVLQ